MGRGLDGYFDTRVGGLCSFEGPRRGPGLEQFPVALAWGKHLFPFRTEQLSPTAPMVLGLHGPGRVGRRRFFHHTSRPAGRLVVVSGRRGAAASPAAVPRCGRCISGAGRALLSAAIPVQRNCRCSSSLVAVGALALPCPSPCSS